MSFIFFLTLGPTLPKKCNRHEMVDIGEHLYIIGGDDGNDYLNEIQKLTCVSSVCSWTTLTQQLKVGRSNTVAIPVIDSFCTPN